DGSPSSMADRMRVTSDIGVQHTSFALPMPAPGRQKALPLSAKRHRIRCDASDAAYCHPSFPFRYWAGEARFEAQLRAHLGNVTIGDVQRAQVVVEVGTGGSFVAFQDTRTDHERPVHVVVDTAALATVALIGEACVLGHRAAAER